jgi:hypothetical protein
MGGGGSTYDYGFRIYNPQLGRFLSVDPLTRSYPFYTPYQFAGNKPIQFIDLDGLEEAEPKKDEGNTQINVTNNVNVTWTVALTLGSASLNVRTPWGPIGLQLATGDGEIDVIGLRDNVLYGMGRANGNKDAPRVSRNFLGLTFLAGVNHETEMNDGKPVSSSTEIEINNASIQIDNNSGKNKYSYGVKGSFLVGFEAKVSVSTPDDKVDNPKLDYDNAIFPSGNLEVLDVKKGTIGGNNNKSGGNTSQKINFKSTPENKETKAISQYIKSL